jgi:hypothetical protein
LCRIGSAVAFATHTTIAIAITVTIIAIIIATAVRLSAVGTRCTTETVHTATHTMIICRVTI